MDSRAIRTPEGARAILKHNKEILYHLPKQYKNLARALKDVKSELYDVINFCMENEPIIWKQKYTWFLTSVSAADVMNRGSKQTGNKRFNYLACIGVITKLPQTEESATGVNMTFRLNDKRLFKSRFINTFTIPMYTPKKLEEMERRAALLMENKITPGNISNDKLKASNCEELAKMVFFDNSTKSIQNKSKEYELILKHLNVICDKNGYATKEMLCSSLGWNRDKLDNLLKVFKNQWLQQYDYKAPKKEETERYNLESKSWIIIRREEHG